MPLRELSTDLDAHLGCAPRRGLAVSQEAFLSMHEYHLSREKARKRVLATLTQLTGTPCNSLDWKSGEVTVSDGKKSVKFKAADMEQEARRTGIVGVLQRAIDNRDGVFGGTLGDASTPNHQLKITTEYAGWRKEVEGPCRIGVATDDLMEDILHYREEICRVSADYDFRVLSRHYRAYLGACISIVDAFINRHILLASHDRFESEAFTRLQVARGMEEKVECWLQTCSEKTLKAIANREEWCHFQELRQERNALQHAVEPFSVYSIRVIAKYLNYTRTGIGALLKLLRSIHSKPTLGFIERLRTAPEVSFNRITLKATGASDAAGETPAA